MGWVSSVTGTVSDAYNDATDWASDKLGLEPDSVSSGPVGRYVNGKPKLGTAAQTVITPSAVTNTEPKTVKSRARITPLGAGANLFGSGTIMAPLRLRNALVFPYTPTLQVSSTAEYEPTNISHTVYKPQSYAKSYMNEMTLTAEFTAQTIQEARYMLACMHFFRSVTKSYFGASNGELAGAPPPVVRFDYLGNQMFNNVPVVIKSYSYVLPPDVDYVIINEAGLNTQVPTAVTITITMEVYYNPYKLRDTFSVAAFRNGDLLSQGYI